MKTVPELDVARERYLAQHAAFLSGRGSEAGWLRDLRTQAIERFGALGFPSTRHEEWKYTDVRPIARLETPVASQQGLNGLATAGTQKWNLQGALRLVYVNGRFSPELSQTAELPQ